MCHGSESMDAARRREEGASLEEVRNRLADSRKEAREVGAMTAVERYRNELVEALWADGRYHIDIMRCVVELADKAVAELEADLTAMTKEGQDLARIYARVRRWMLWRRRGVL